MQVKYWTNFNKRKNSTKQPSGGTDISVSLKNPCSVENPQIEVVGVPDSANYFYIADFGRYYFRSDAIKVTKDITQFSLEVDTMATYKSQIGSTTAYIERSQSNYDLKIPDPYNSPTDDYDTSTATHTMSGISWDTTGCYIFGCIGKASSGAIGANGVARYYALSSIQMSYLANILCDHSWLEKLVQEFTNPMDCVISCSWLPISPSMLTTTSESVYLGSYDTGLTGQLITGRQYGLSVPSSIILNFPGSIPRDYRRGAPYTTGVIYLPFVGTVPLDVDVVFPYDSIDVSYALDVFTGDIAYNIWRAGKIISTYSGNCATKIPLAASAYSATGVGSGILCAIGGVAASMITFVQSSGLQALMAIGAGIGSIAGGAAVAVKSTEVHTSINGGSSSAISVFSGTDITVLIITKAALHEPGSIVSRVGGLCKKLLQISTIPGYIQCVSASVDMPGTVAEKDTVNGYVNGGFYYE